MPDNKEKMQGHQQDTSSSQRHSSDKDETSQKNQRMGSHSAEQNQPMKGGGKKSNK